MLYGVGGRYPLDATPGASKMTDKHESTGYYTQRPSKREREKATAAAWKDRIMADLDDSTGKYFLDSNPDSGILRERKHNQEIDK